MVRHYDFWHLCALGNIGHTSGMKLYDFFQDHELNLTHLAGVSTWAIVSYIALTPLWAQGAGGLVFLSVAGLLLLYMGLLLAASWGERKGPSLSLRWWVLGVIPLVLMVLMAVQSHQVVLILLIIYAAILPAYFSLLRALTLLVSIHLLITALVFWRWQGDGVIVASVLNLGFEMFALVAMHTAVREKQAREQLSFTHMQLLATQQLLSETSKQDERLRISRDLHDVVGHHLTGLSLTLELIRHLSEGPVREHTEKAQAITKLLLADVRQVVSDLREAHGVDIVAALKCLSRNSGLRPQVDLQMAKALVIADAQVAEVIFRSVQEILTNCRRHSDSTCLTVQLREENDGWLLTTTETPSQHALPSELPWGNGLKGMQERIAAVHGQITLCTEQGLCHQITIPKL